ncbi:hypothetical protein NDA01_29420 [Trichocoleus desertorum AS-A10]|uniref:hypothetical protein n=1 Tax=Trichocoleus desertorum TaxID=1481672 RepID=UPI0032971747
MARDVNPEMIMNSVLGKISDVLLNGDGKVIPRSDDHYLAFCSPGYPLTEDFFNYALEGFGGIVRRGVNPNKLDQTVGPEEGKTEEGSSEVDTAALAADARRKYMAAETFAALCDLVPDTSGIVNSGRINTWNPETRISHAYALALQFSQVYNVEPDAATKSKLERWRSLLQETKKEVDLVTEEEVEVLRETALVQKYREKMLAYYGEALAYNTMRISALAGQDEQAVHQFAINAPLMQMKVRAAENDWISNGYRDTYDRINAAIAAVEGRSFALLKQRYKEDFVRSILTNPSSGANFLYTAPAPAEFARADSGWSEFYFNSGSFNSNHKFSASHTSGGGGLAIGPFAIGGGGSVDKKKWEGKLNAESFNLRFKMARATIYRPGINLAYIKSGFWRFDQQNEEYKNTLLSNGKTPPNGLMPAITTDCIFVKDLCIDFGEYNSEYERRSQEIGGRGGLSYGPFFLGGSHSNRESESTYNRNWTREGLKIEGLQLLGFLCHTLEKCPDPNPKVTDWI